MRRERYIKRKDFGARLRRLRARSAFRRLWSDVMMENVSPKL